SVQGFWCVRDDRNMLFNFGGHRDEAQRALAIIKQHEFDRMGLIGQGTPAMMVFLGTPPGLTATPMHPPPPPRGRLITQGPVVPASQSNGDIPPSTLQPSRMQPTTSLAPRSEPNAPDARGRSSAVAGNDLVAAAMSYGRQLAPPSDRSIDLSILADRVPL